MINKVVAIGEILWDVFPEGKKAGGSSMNVSLHLHKQGITSALISAIGDDQNGQALLRFLADQKFPTTLIQTNSLPTSTVEVKLDAHQQATYHIVEPVAWDEIKLTPQIIEAVNQADAFVYCSLTCRNETSKETILALLELNKLNVFDINLRAPHHHIDTLTTLLRKANILKVNEDELIYLKEQLQFTGDTEEQLIKQLSLAFQIQIICLTLGDKGAKVLHENKLYQHRGYQAEVVDTVGAGDAFLATFISSYLNGYTMEMILDRACKVGAYVASQSGANPSYNKSIFNA